MGFVIEQAPGLLNAAIGGMGDMVPGGGGILVGYGRAPFLPWHKTKPGRLAKRGGDTLGVPAKGERGGRDDVETLPDGGIASVDRGEERKRDIRGMDVMHGLHSHIGQRQHFSRGQGLEDAEIEVSGRV